MDVVEDNAPIPMKDANRILAKVSRLGLSGVVGVPIAAVAQPIATRAAPVAQKAAAPSPKQEVNLFEDDETPADQTKRPAPERRKSDKLISFDDHDATPAAAPAAASFGGDFLDFAPPTSSSPMVSTNLPVICLQYPCITFITSITHTIIMM
jgi:hypothetical protein